MMYLFGILIFFIPNLFINYVDVSEIEFAKDLSSFLFLSTQESRCKGNILVSTPECNFYLNFAIQSLSNWDITIVVIDYEKPFSTLDSELRENWKKFLRWRSEPCNIIFICDLNRDKIQNTNIGFLEYPKLIRGFDQLIYFSDFDFNFNQKYAWRVLDAEKEVLKQSSVLMSAKVVNKTKSESLIEISSICFYCKSYENSVNETLLGFWQRNRTLISPFFEIFNGYHSLNSFLNFNFKIGYRNYIPQLNCQHKFQCSGVEYEILNTISNSLALNYTLLNYTKDENIINTRNVNASLIDDISSGKLEIGIGGIHVKREGVLGLDFTQEFLQESIVFVIERRHKIYILGIFLPFQPHVWPVLIIACIAVSFLLVYISRRQNVSLPISYGFQFSLSYLVGQPLTHHYITQRPRFLLKLILSLWWFTCVTIGVLYNTTLITSLINPVRLREPDSLRDLLLFDYKFMVTDGRRGGSVLELLLDLTGPQKQEDNAIKLIKERLINRTLDSSNGFVAFVTEESSVQSIDWKKSYGFTSIKIIKENLFRTGYGWGVRSNAPYKTKLDSALCWLTATGLVEYWWENSAKTNQKLYQSSNVRLKNKLSQIQMNLEVLQGAFIFLLLGCGISFGFFILEIWKSKYTFRFFTRQELIYLCSKLVDSIYSDDNIKNKNKVVKYNRKRKYKSKQTLFVKSSKFQYLK